MQLSTSLKVDNKESKNDWLETGMGWSKTKVSINFVRYLQLFFDHPKKIDMLFSKVKYSPEKVSFISPHHLAYVAHKHT